MYILAQYRLEIDNEDKVLKRRPAKTEQLYLESPHMYIYFNAVVRAHHSCFLLSPAFLSLFIHHFYDITYSIPGLDQVRLGRNRESCQILC